MKVPTRVQNFCKFINNVNVMCAKTNISLKKRFMFREFKEFIPHLNLLFVVRHLNSDVDCRNRK